MNKFEVAIVGGGAAGLLCAVELLKNENAFNGKQIAIIERNDRVGKKLIATGNGRGNLSNTHISCDCYHGNPVFIKKIVNDILNFNLKKYFQFFGVETTEENGKIFPLSFQANSFLDIIRAYLISKGAQIITSTKIINIKKDKDFFCLKSIDNLFYAKNVVLAVGGKCAKQFGTDGSSYVLAESFGHKTTKLYPSLVQLKTDLEPIRGLKGIKEYAKISAFDGDTFLKSAEGDLLFTEFGLSGSSIFSISGYLAQCKNPYLSIEFLPSVEFNNLQNIIQDRLTKNYFVDCGILTGLLNKKIGEKIVRDNKNKNGTLSSLSLANSIKNYRVKVTGTLGMDYAQVTKGGIITDNINSTTFESELEKNLYIVGEMLNVDGDCGGYNLTFAFISGITAGRSIKESFNR